MILFLYLSYIVIDPFTEAIIPQAFGKWKEVTDLSELTDEISQEANTQRHELSEALKEAGINEKTDCYECGPGLFAASWCSNCEVIYLCVNRKHIDHFHA